MRAYQTIRKEIAEVNELTAKREQMSKEAWIKNVLRIYPEKTRHEVEELHSKLFGRKTD